MESESWSKVGSSVITQAEKIGSRLGCLKSPTHTQHRRRGRDQSWSKASRSDEEEETNTTTTTTTKKKKTIRKRKSTKQKKKKKKKKKKKERMTPTLLLCTDNGLPVLF
ncbi:unnamed protein product [Protopolystoma xenopodis]|uniref:Uncharacterized protein n=1 Tax=Protopolystoma xenopodis TaxID=117903 RepID=A0A448WQY6_9PLAT|nr:unnamed protein product [Protopolystoma xenopodis]